MKTMTKRFVAAGCILGLAAKSSAQTSGPSGGLPDGWSAQWATANCTGGTIGAGCADVHNLTYVPPAAGEMDGYFWQPPAPAVNGVPVHGGCSQFGVGSGASANRPCGTADLQFWCFRQAYVNFVASCQAAGEEGAAQGNDDSFWVYTNGLNAGATVVTSMPLAPNWADTSVFGATARLFGVGAQTLTFAEREDGSRCRRFTMTAGYPDCQFGAPPYVSNNTVDAVLGRLLDLETSTDDRVSAVSTMLSALNSTVTSSLVALNATISAQISAYDLSLQQDLSSHESLATATEQSLATANVAVSQAIASVVSRLGGVSSFSAGGAATLTGTPVVQTSGADVWVNAASGGTVRVNGAQCQTDLCGLAAQVAQVTNALRGQ